MAEANWAGLVYSRTSRIDFRFIAMPRGFLDPDRQAAYSYIQVTTALPEKLDERPIWSVYPTPNFFVFGVTCAAIDLLGTEAELYRDCLADQSGRSLYLFAGYAMPRKSKPREPLPEFTETDLRLFRPLYDYIQRAWPETSRESIEASPASIPRGRVTPVSSVSQRYFALNRDFTVTRVWQHSNYNCRQLWRTISAVGETEPELSLCLGLPRAELAKHGPFWNATVDNQRAADMSSNETAVCAGKEDTSERSHRREEAVTRGTTANSQSHPVSPKSSGESRKSAARPSAAAGAIAGNEEDERKGGTALGSLEAAFKNLLRPVLGHESTGRDLEKTDKRDSASPRKPPNDEQRQSPRPIQKETPPVRRLADDDDDDFTL